MRKERLWNDCYCCRIHHNASHRRAHRAGAGTVRHDPYAGHVPRYADCPASEAVYLRQQLQPAGNPPVPAGRRTDGTLRRRGPPVQPGPCFDWTGEGQPVLCNRVAGCHAGCVSGLRQCGGGAAGQRHVPQPEKGRLRRGVQRRSDRCHLYHRSHDPAGTTVRDLRLPGGHLRPGFTSAC